LKVTIPKFRNIVINIRQHGHVGVVRMCGRIHQQVVGSNKIMDIQMGCTKMCHATQVGQKGPLIISGHNHDAVTRGTFSLRHAAILDSNAPLVCMGFQQLPVVISFIPNPLQPQGYMALMTIS
jgi:hypothetical protein